MELVAKLMGNWIMYNPTETHMIIDLSHKLSSDIIIPMRMETSVALAIKEARERNDASSIPLFLQY